MQNGTWQMSKTKSTELTYSQLRQLVFETAGELYKRGPGWAQEGVVLDEVFKQAGGQYRHDRYDQLQQRILTCWHDLFLAGELSWGLNLDNSNAPFYHIPPKDEERERTLKRVEKG